MLGGGGEVTLGSDGEDGGGDAVEAEIKKTSKAEQRIRTDNHKKELSLVPVLSAVALVWIENVAGSDPCGVSEDRSADVAEVITPPTMKNWMPIVTPLFLTVIVCVAKSRPDIPKRLVVGEGIAVPDMDAATVIGRSLSSW